MLWELIKRFKIRLNEFPLEYLKKNLPQTNYITYIKLQQQKTAIW